MGEHERVFIVEDKAYLREPVIDILLEAGHEVVFQAGDMPTALNGVSVAAELGVTVGVLDGNLSVGDNSCDDGRTLAAKLREAVPGVRIVSFSDSLRADYGDFSVDKSDRSINVASELVRVITDL